jgi:hypothetical protein
MKHVLLFFLIGLCAILAAASFPLYAPDNGLTCVITSSSVSPSITLSDSIHGYVIGNLSATQEPGYSYPGVVSPMPSQDIIIGQALGNSTITAYYNGSIVTNTQGHRIYNVPFSNQIQLAVRLPKISGIMEIVISSASINATKSFSYHLNIMSTTQFIHYEYSVHNQKIPTITYTISDTWATVFMVLMIAFGAMFLTMYVRPLQWRNTPTKGDHK